jgi:pyruvate ferredoxin oxidoreductase gamma subunit
VTASELLAEAALHEGKYFQAFPDYGPERMGAPIRAYTRISSSPIMQHHQITEPDAVVVLDPTLLGVVDVTAGLDEGGLLLINTPLSPNELRRELGFDKGRVFTIDATRVALDTIKRNITNTPMIGALLRALEVVNRDAVREEIKKRFNTRVSEEVAKANVEAFDRAYKEVREG